MTVEGIGTIRTASSTGVDPLPRAEGAEAELMARVFYDLSDRLSNDTSEFEFNKHEITYVTPEADRGAVGGVGARARVLARTASRSRPRPSPSRPTRARTSTRRSTTARP